MKIYKGRLILFLSIIALTFSQSSFGQKPKSHDLESPNQKIKIEVTVDNNTHGDTSASASFKVYFKDHGIGTEVLLPSFLGLSTESESFKNIKLLSVSNVKHIFVSYQMITGERKLCKNESNEQLFSFSNANGKRLNVIFRAYNDGISFKYQLLKGIDKTVNVTDEFTTYQIPFHTERWLQQYDPSYEDYYPYSTTGKGAKGAQWGYPALFKAKGQPVYYLISEAGLSEENCAARLDNSINPDSYKVTYPEPPGRF